MASDVESPKREATPTASLSSIPQKRAIDEDHSPAVPSPLNPENKPSDSQQPEDASQSNRQKPARTKKDTFKKREARNGDRASATPDPKAASKEPIQSENGPLRYKLAPPKQSDLNLPRGPVMTSHHQVTTQDGQTVEFFETSDQYAASNAMSIPPTMANLALQCL